MKKNNEVSNFLGALEFAARANILFISFPFEFQKFSKEDLQYLSDNRLIKQFINDNGEAEFIFHVYAVKFLLGNMKSKIQPPPATIDINRVFGPLEAAFRWNISLSKLLDSLNPNIKREEHKKAELDAVIKQGLVKIYSVRFRKEYIIHENAMRFLFGKEKDKEL